MPQSLETFIKKMERRLERLARVKNPAIKAADNVISAGIPVYTGAYKKAVKKKSTADYAGIWVDEKGLRAAQPEFVGYYTDKDGVQHPSPAGPERADWNLHGSFAPADGPYPIRIELYGGPKYGVGAGMWEQAAETAREVVAAEMARVARSN